MMGFAIQRGGTCMVAAIDEGVSSRRWSRALALFEASLWVGGLLALLMLAGWRITPPAYNGWVLAAAGGTMLGLGAWFNRACAFGTVARFGSGESGYLAMPLGFLAGCRLENLLIQSPLAMAAMPLSALPLLLALAFVALAAWRGQAALAAAKNRDLAAFVWHPHRATIVIALAYFALMLVAGPWSYTDWLADVAKGADSMTARRGVLFAALLGGALAGGWTAGGLELRKPQPTVLARSFIGGLLMGVGARLVPGGNDGLVLIGLPELQAGALVALAAMAITIAAVVVVAGRVHGTAAPEA